MNRREVLRVLFILFLGQVVSLFIAVCSFTSSLLADLGVDTPLTQSSFNYLALGLVYGSILLYKREKLKVSWYWYAFLGFIDVQGNYLGTRYSLPQFLGAGMCVLGLGLILLSDAGVSGGGGRKPLLGDFLVIAGTFCYAISNVGEEYCIKKKDCVEVVAMLGVYGLIVSVFEILIFEREGLQSVKWSGTVIALFAGFVAAQFIFYSIVPFVLKMSGSTLFNLSLLTSDMWAVFIRIFFYHQKVDWLYYLSFAIVAIGLVLYSISNTSSIPATAGLDEEVQYQAVIFEENSDSRNEALLPN